MPLEAGADAPDDARAPLDGTPEPPEDAAAPLDDTTVPLDDPAAVLDGNMAPLDDVEPVPDWEDDCSPDEACWEVPAEEPPELALAVDELPREAAEEEEEAAREEETRTPELLEDELAVPDAAPLLEPLPVCCGTHMPSTHCSVAAQASSPPSHALEPGRHPNTVTAARQASTVHRATRWVDVAFRMVREAAHVCMVSILCWASANMIL